MKTIYYSISFLPIMYELMVVSNIHVMNEKINNYKIAVKKGNFDSLSSGQKTFSICQLMYFAYCLFGLMSNQYILFSILLIISLMPKNYKVLRFIDSLISAMILVFSGNILYGVGGGIIQRLTYSC